MTMDQMMLLSNCEGKTSSRSLHNNSFRGSGSSGSSVLSALQSEQSNKSTAML